MHKIPSHYLAPDSTLMLTYEHIVIQIKNITDVIYQKLYLKAL